MAGNGRILEWKGRWNGRKEEKINAATVKKKWQVGVSEVRGDRRER